MADSHESNQAETQKSRGGRPRATDPLSSAVSTRLKTHEHDRLIRLARKRERSVSSLVRQLLVTQLR